MASENREIVRPFEKLSNFRDIGGYTVKDGRKMKSGILYRSDDLSRLSAKDMDTMRQLNLKIICDLRTVKESKSKVSKVPVNEGITIANIPIDYENPNFSRAKVFGFLFAKSGGADFEQFIRDYYRRMAFDRTPQINEIFTLIAEQDKIPALIHCTAGKDRTGYVSALIQLIAGVPMPQVLDDYLLTNSYYEPRITKFVKVMRWMSLFRVSTERIKHILEVRPEYLDELLTDIFKEHGTIEDYLCRACAIKEQKLLDFREFLLEDPK